MGFAIVGVSLFLLAVTPLSYAFNDHGPLSMLMFWLGLGGESNLGAWWSGVLFLLSAIFALDRSSETERTPVERRGWAALAAALVLLSFDEIAALHEFLSARNRAYLIPLGLLGLGLVGYSLIHLRRAGVSLRRLLLAFALLASVPIQERVQQTHEWRDVVIYGVRVLLEEGTEIVAALLLVAGTSGGLLRLRMGPRTFASLARFGTPLLWLALIALPIAALAVYPVNLAGASNWLGTTLFLCCALLAQRQAALRRDPVLLMAAALYLLASLGANAVRPDWDPLVLGVEVKLRGVYFGTLLLAAPWVLSAGQPWRQRAFWLALAGCTLLAAFLLVRPQVVWSTWPPTIALLCFYIEISAAMRPRTAIARDAAVATNPGVTRRETTRGTPDSETTLGHPGAEAMQASNAAPKAPTIATPF
ncbi:MAG TPA: hypothetical protein VM692_02090 [Gammaproteobacteria bacterium]|nr:hypothetical protein [Gammaproteobacteria bacterium]